MIADNILRQEKLESQFVSFKEEVGDVTQRLGKLEKKATEDEYMMSARSWFERKGLNLGAEKELELVMWCENISLSESKSRIASPDGERLNAKFHVEVISRAKGLVETSKG